MTEPVTFTLSVMFPSMLSVALYPGSTYAAPNCIVMVAFPCSVMTGGMVSATVTVRFCCIAVLLELSATSYDIVYVPNAVEFTEPLTLTLPVTFPSTSSVAL